MANKFLKRTLSVIMCVALIASMFAMSVSVAADDAAGDTVAYDWDYTGDAGSDAVTATKNGTQYYTNATAGAKPQLSYSSDKYAYVSNNANYKRCAYVINATEGYDPATLTVVTPNNTTRNPAYGAGAVVLGIITRGSGEAAVSHPLMAFIRSVNYGSAEAAYMIEDVKGSWATSNLSTWALDTYLKNGDGEYLDGKYKTAIGTDITVANLNNLLYTHHVTVKQGTVEFYADITYTDGDSEYKTSTKPLQINLETLQEKDSTITGFTPAFGIGSVRGDNVDSKFYSVQATYKRGCEHKNTKTIPAVDATCTTTGKTEEVLCADCGDHISGGEITEALGHSWGAWEIITAATQEDDGLRRHTCTRAGCDAYEDEVIEALSGNTVYKWDYTNATTGETDYNDTIAKSVRYNATRDRFSYNSEGYLQITSYEHTALVVDTPEKMIPSKFSMTSPNTIPSNGNYYGTGAAVIGLITKSDGNVSPLHVSVSSTNYGKAKAELNISNKASYNTQTTGYVYYKTLNLNFKDVASNVYEDVLGFDIAKEKLGSLTYEYNIKVEDDDVTINVTITYTDPTTKEKQKIEAEPITISVALADIQGWTNGSTVTAFEPAFGIARVANGTPNDNPTKIYKVRAEYAKACEHNDTVYKDEIAATCTKPGHEAGEYCNECGKYIDGSKVIPATGHDYEVTEREEPSCKDGYVNYKCSVCGDEYTETLPATGEHVKGEKIETVEPSCKVGGYTLYKCSECGENFKADETDPIGSHVYDFSNGNYKVTKVPTETEDGLEEWICPRCKTNGSNLSYPLKKIQIGVSQTQVKLKEGIYFEITVKANNYFTDSSLKLTITNTTTGEVMKFDEFDKLDSKDESITVENDGYYNYYTVRISKFAHQMTDKYDVTFEGEIEKSTRDAVIFETPQKFTSTKTGISVASNLEDIYKNEDEAYVPFHKLAAKLANYGAAAQEYDTLANGTKYEQLANYFLADDDENKTTAEDAYTAMTNTASGRFYDDTKDIFAQNFKASLAIGLQTNIKMIVKVSNITLADGQSLWVKMGDVEQKLENNNGVYSAAFGEFAPADYATDKTITLVVKNANGSTAEESAEVTYSVGAYINRMANKTGHESLKPLLNAITEYWQAATSLS